MSDYRVADGHDVALVSLNVLSPQPRSRGIQYTRRSYAADGTPINEGAFVELIWGVVADDAALQSILTTFGIYTATSNDVTVYVRNENFDYVRKNGKAIKPQIGEGLEWSNYFPRDLVILIRNLQNAS